MSALDNEITGNGMVTFEHFGREWAIPATRHLSHVRRMRDEVRGGVGSIDLMIAEVFLHPAASKANQQDPDQFADLLDLDPTEGQLDEFTAALSNALGLGDSGNSAPSSASS